MKQVDLMEKHKKEGNLHNAAERNTKQPFLRTVPVSRRALVLMMIQKFHHYEWHYDPILQ